jgi:uncharacterized Zn finger protein
MTWRQMLLNAALLAPVVYGVIWLWLRIKKQGEKCPVCGEKEGLVIKKEPVDVGFYEKMSGTYSGGNTEIVTTFEVSYRCRHCGHHWQRTIREWG